MKVSPFRLSLTAALLAAAAAGSVGWSRRSAELPATSPENADIPAPPAAVAVTPSAPVEAAPAPSEASAAPPALHEARAYSKSRFAWIMPEPYTARGWIGYLGLGGSVALRGGSADAARTLGRGCAAWYSVEPRGYICPGKRATLDPDDPTVVALRGQAPKVDSPWPYEYAESTGTPRYPTLPTLSEQVDAEPDLDAHLANVAWVRALGSASEDAIREIDENLVGVDLSPAGTGPGELFPFGLGVRETRKEVVRGSTVAFTRAFDAGDRTWVVTSDQALIPKDRLKLYPRSQFHGVWLKDGRSLPIAFFRKTSKPKFRKRADGRFEPTGESFARLSWVELTDRVEGEGGERFLETKKPSLYVRASDAVILRAALHTENEPGAPPRTWIEVSVLGGWLIAYEELTPVFATLISPGRGLLPQNGVPETETAATPLGNFRIDGKFVTATMVSSFNEKILHTEVQFVQNFHGPHSLHAAYWHDAWGEPKSGGCVNLSPIDAKEMFSWTEPKVPDGWHGLRGMPDAGRSTRVLIHR
jgi:hypothetical protein